MKIIADLHMHSHYSRATSKNMNIQNIDKYAKIKGLNLIGTGDFTHPRWFAEMKSVLTEDAPGIYKYKSDIKYMLTGEISLMYKQDGRGRRIHFLIFVPNFDVASQITDWLKTKGRVDYDGRPIFGFSAIEFTEAMMSISKDIMLIPAHCLLPNEHIQTINGMIPISEIKESSMVLTHKGNFKEVTEILKRKYDGEVIGLLSSCYNDYTFFTPEHPIYAIKSFKTCKNVPHTICKPNCAYLKRGCKYPQFKEYNAKWIKTNDIEKGDITLYPIHKKIKNIKYLDMPQFLSSKFYIENEYIKSRKEKMFIKNLGVNRKIVLSKNFCRLIGYYLAEGYFSRDHIAFSFNKNETEYIEDVKNLLKECFGTFINIKIERDKENAIFIKVYSKILVDFFKIFYKKQPYRAPNKYLHPLFLDLPIQKQKEILIGWWRGDAGGTTSINLISQIRTILFRLKVIPVISIATAEKMNTWRDEKNNTIKGRKIVAKNDYYSISHLCFFDKNLDLLKLKEFKKYKSKLDRRKGYFDDNYVYLPITKITKRKYSGYVYNLEVKDDNSYTTKSLTVHNCMTPWFGILGSKGGFNSIEECFRDQTKHIHALETGLSADPSMLWRISSLDKFSLISNSDSHSYYSWKLGREANVFELNKLTYQNIINAIKTKKGFEYTIEVDPGFGKYHWDGHRACNVFLSPKETKKLNGICPKCKKPLTIGVEYRIEELADRPEGFVPKNSIPFKKLLPLAEILAAYYKAGVATKKVQNDLNKLINEFESELNVLLEAPEEKLKSFSKPISDLIIKNRIGKIRVEPGYDGVYGKIKTD